MSKTEAEATAPPPKAFVSYSWTSEPHITWVVQLCERLSHDGVHVILDRWDLKEGHDKYRFMEQMVTDESVSRVLMVCDAEYVAKADGRIGGVGEESQIISPEIYREARQEKFLPLVRDTDEDGRPLLPAFLASRIYFDFTTPEREEASYEQLLRNIYNRPRYQRPPIGQPPAFLGDEPVVLQTASKSTRLMRSVEAGSPLVKGHFRDYLAGLHAAVEDRQLFSAERIKGLEGENFDDVVVSDINRFEPYRNEWISVLSSLERYASLGTFAPEIHSFFEGLSGLLGCPKDVYTWNETWDNHRAFIVRELFVLMTAVMLETRAFGVLGRILTEPYFWSDRAEAGYRSFASFDRYLPALESVRKSRLKLNRASLTADIMRERAERSGPPFDRIMDAECILFIRSVLEIPADDPPIILDVWRPTTLVFRDRNVHAGELRPRLQSMAFFEAFKPVLGVASLTDLRKRVDHLAKSDASETLVRLGMFSALSGASIGPLLDIDRVGSLP